MPRRLTHSHASSRRYTASKLATGNKSGRRKNCGASHRLKVTRHLHVRQHIQGAALYCAAARCMMATGSRQRRTVEKFPSELEFIAQVIRNAKANRGKRITVRFGL